MGCCPSSIDLSAEDVERTKKHGQGVGGKKSPGEASTQMSTPRYMWERQKEYVDSQRERAERQERHRLEKAALEEEEAFHPTPSIPDRHVEKQKKKAVDPEDEFFGEAPTPSRRPLPKNPYGGATPRKYERSAQRAKTAAGRMEREDSRASLASGAGRGYAPSPRRNYAPSPRNSGQEALYLPSPRRASSAGGVNTDRFMMNKASDASPRRGEQPYGGGGVYGGPPADSTPKRGRDQISRTEGVSAQSPRRVTGQSPRVATQSPRQAYTNAGPSPRRSTAVDGGTGGSPHSRRQSIDLGAQAQSPSVLQMRNGRLIGNSPAGKFSGRHSGKSGSLLLSEDSFLEEDKRLTPQGAGRLSGRGEEARRVLEREREREREEEARRLLQRQREEQARMEALRMRERAQAQQAPPRRRQSTAPEVDSSDSESEGENIVKLGEAPLPSGAATPKRGGLGAESPQSRRHSYYDFNGLSGRAKDHRKSSLLLAGSANTKTGGGSIKLGGSTPKRGASAPGGYTPRGGRR